MRIASRLAIAASLTFLFLTQAARAVPPEIAIQGVLVNAAGQPLAGTRAWRVQFYDGPTSGTSTALGSPQSGMVDVGVNGRWTIVLAPPPAVLAATGQVWYELAIDSAPTPKGSLDAGDTFTARAQVHSVLFAQRAGDAAMLAGKGPSAYVTTATLVSSLAGYATTASLTSALAGKANVGAPVTDAQVPDGITINHAGSANTATTATTAILAQAASALTGARFVMVKTSANAAANGTALLAAYATAKTMSPASGDPVTVIVPPAQYDLGSGALIMDTPWIDLAGLTTDRERQHIYGTGNGDNTGVLTQTANNVQIENLVVECTRNAGSTLNSDIAAYFPNATQGFITGSTSGTLIQNCVFKADNVHAVSMRYTVVYAGTYQDCVCGDYAFGSSRAAIGTFIRCTAGDESFGAKDTASGTFTDCTGGPHAFGGDHGTAGGTFIRCTAGDESFGAQGAAPGTFSDCMGGVDAFGGTGTASGAFTNCTGLDYSFGGSGTASGTFTNCTGVDYSFGYGGTASGTFAGCRGRDLSFGAHGTASGNFINCTAGNSSFGANGVANGAFSNCAGGFYAFGGLGTASGSFTACSGQLGAFGGSGGVASGGFYNCTSSVYSFGYNGTATGVFYQCIAGDSSFSTNGNPVIVDCVRGGVTYTGSRSVTVQTGSNPAANGAQLQAAYATARTMSPASGDAVTVIVPPGQYDLGTAALALDTPWIDLIGQVSDRERQHIYGTGNGSNTGVITQTADHVQIENLFLECTNTTNPNQTIAAYYPNATWGAQNGSTSGTLIQNCTFKADGAHAVSMRFNVSYVGTYKDCVGGLYAFGGGGKAGGTFTDCAGGDASFGAIFGTASGTFTGCTGGLYAFGGDVGIASGTFSNCTGGDESFGGTGTASGTFTNCTGGLGSFGAAGTALGGHFYACIGGAGAFTNIGNPAPVFLFCIQNKAKYAGNQ